MSNHIERIAAGANCLRRTSWVGAAVVLTAMGLGGCSKLGMGQDEMSWARAALDRNQQIEVVAADPQARTFTVRVKASGQLVVVPVDQVVAGPAGMSASGPSENLSAAAAQATAAQQATAPTPAPEVAAAVPPPINNPQSDNASAAAGEAAASAGERQNAPSGSAERAAAEAAGPHAASVAQASAGSVLASGPGYTIKASGPKGGPPRSSSASSAARGALERMHEPIICQGARLLHIDNRNLEFDGDAVNAEDGCEIHITNTRITAKGVGVLARAANVHIDNSDIEGESGAIDASEGAQVYASSSRFKGLNRHMEASAFHDLGGNTWN